MVKSSQSKQKSKNSVQGDSVKGDSAPEKSDSQPIAKTENKTQRPPENNKYKKEQQDISADSISKSEPTTVSQTRAGVESAERTRKKFLNVVYFIDSARTRSFRISLSRLNLLVLMLAAAALWSALSVFIIAWSLVDRFDILQEMTKAKANLLAYETRYEQLFENAYPSNSNPDTLLKPADEPMDMAMNSNNHPRNGDSSKLRELSSDSPTSENRGTDKKVNPNSGLPSSSDKAKSDQKSKSVPHSSVTDKTVTKEPSSPTQIISKQETPKSETEGLGSSSQSAASNSTNEKSPAATTKKSSVVVQDPVLEQGSKSLDLSFKIVNQDPKRSSGRVWAVAELEVDGKTVFVPFPEQLSLDNQGYSISPTVSHRFSIRRFTNKKFTFEYENSQNTHTYRKIKIFLGDNDGKNVQEFEVPVNLKF